MSATMAADGRIVAFEASEDACTLIRANAALNGLADRVLVVNALIAERSGLQRVNSDADKVAAVQAAIAAEPAPIHVPRERPPLVISDEGPLVLVETRKDLRNLNLPF